MGHRLFHSLAVIGVLATPAQATDCSLALILALDVSGSVDAIEDRLQREGAASAILAQPVKAAFLDRAPVALFVFEWSMSSHQEPLLPGWKIIDSEEDLVVVAEAIRGSRPGDVARLNPTTAVGSALGYAAMALRDAPRCDAVTIDISGDGENNDGFTPSVAYATYPLDGVTVNALVIAGDEDARPSWEHGDVIGWFQAEVVRGPGAFAIIADSYSDYARAMEMKLLRELELPVVGELIAGGGAP
jgi:hypothetical protein